MKTTNLFVDMDNTLIVNPYDSDITGNITLFLRTWRGLKTEPFNGHLIEWLKTKEFILLTNRGQNTINKVKAHLVDLGLLTRCNKIVCCSGKKSSVIKELRLAKKDAFIIDNNEKYKPNLLITQKTTKNEITQAYFNYFIYGGNYEI